MKITHLALLATVLGFGSQAAHLEQRNAFAEHRKGASIQVVAGYSRRIAADWVILAEFIRQTEHEKDEDSNIVELGFRWQVTPLTVVSFGGGAGIGRESPKARAVVAFQKSL